MARAAAIFTPDRDGSWRPTGVVLASRRYVQCRVLPGVGLGALRDRVNLLARAPMNDARTGREDLEAWIGWAVRNLSDGRTAMLRECDPEATLGQLYRRVVLHVDAGPPGGPRRPRVMRQLPVGLGGPRAAGGV